MMVAKIGYTQVLDRKCPTHGGHYSSYEKSVCPKCSAGLIELTRVTVAGDTVKYCITEVTLYPLHTDDMMNNLIKRTKAAGGLMYTYRLSLFGHYDKATDTVTPDNRTRYLVPKRVIRLELNDFPVKKLYFSTRMQAQMIEVKYVFNDGLKDELEFCDDKQESQQYIQAAEAEKAMPPAVTDAAGIPDQTATGAVGTPLNVSNMGIDELIQIQGKMAARMNEIQTKEVHHKSEAMLGETATDVNKPDPFPGATTTG